MLTDLFFQTDTRLTDLDFRTKMESVLQTRRNIQNVSSSIINHR
jgi:hypothetical protein